MFTTKTNGHAPGQVTPKNDEGTVTVQGNSPQNTTTNVSDFTSKIIAAYTRITARIKGFMLYRGMDVCNATMVVLWAIVVMQGIAQWAH